MAKRKTVTNRTLGGLLITALVIQYVFPQIRLGMVSWIGTAIVLGVSLYLLFR